MVANSPARLRLVCPEYRLPGKTITGKWQQATDMGFEGIELSGPASSIKSRWPELIHLHAKGAIFPTVSSGGRPFIGDRDPSARRVAVANLKQLLSAIAELGGLGATTPACFGLYSNALPALKPEPDPSERAVLIDTLADLGQHAESEGVVLLLEPLNRYEDHHLNRLDQGAEIIAAAGTGSVKLLADVFHLNLEETDLPGALRQAAQWLGHVQLADSNRLEPGAGHLDFAAVFRALQDSGYTQYCALECSLSGPAETVLPRVVSYLRAVWRSASEIRATAGGVA
jgi:sugar phosphate isomerase/epimerase